MEFLFIFAVLGLVGYLIGNGKGAGGIGCLLGGLLGPIGWIIVIAMSGNKKQCAYCKEQIHFQASICPHCKKRESIY
ncbi:MAG: hypothetical protein IPL84_03935 [Chitinophagaceae bacterium]|nr:hypothetical protein [Chitinophagaceae bacterium]